MIRCGLQSSAKNLLSRRLPSSNGNKKGTDLNLIRHFVSADIVKTNDGSSDNSNSNSQSNNYRHPYAVKMNASGVIGGATLSQASQMYMHQNSNNFTISKRSFFSRSKSSQSSDNNDNGNDNDTSASVNASTDSIGSDVPMSAEEAIAKFEETASALETTTTTATDAVVTAADVATMNMWEPTWWPQDQMIQLIVNIHDVTGLNYAVTIGAMTIGFRSLMFPLFVKAQRNSSRMAHMKPEMDVLKERMDRLDKKDLAGNQKAMQEFQALYRKYEVNPLSAIAVPLVQMPIFVSMFFGLREMPNIFPEKLADGGMLWFTDLSAPDPTYALPIGCAVSFLLMMELGKEQMMSSSPEQGKMMLTFFRGVAVMMVPLTYSFPTAVFCYWTANNTFSLMQAALFKNKGVRKALDIWEPPKPVPGAPPPKGMADMMKDYMEGNSKDKSKTQAKERIEMHNAAVEKKMMERTGAGPGAGRGRRRRK